MTNPKIVNSKMRQNEKYSDDRDIGVDHRSDGAAVPAVEPAVSAEPSSPLAEGPFLRSEGLTAG